MKKILAIFIAVAMLFLSCEFLPAPGNGDDGRGDGGSGDTGGSGGDVYVIAAKTDTKGEAIRKADQFLDAGYSSEVYAVPSGYYVITLGRFSEQKAEEVKEEAIRKGIAERNEIYTTRGDSFGQRFYPSPQAENFTSDKKFHIIADSSRSKTEAITKANKYIREGYYTEVFLKANRYYLVTLGHFPRERAQDVMRDAMDYNIVQSDAYLTKGDGFLERVYTFRNADHTVVYKPDGNYLSNNSTNDQSPPPLDNTINLPPEEPPVIVLEEEKPEKLNRALHDQQEFAENSPSNRDDIRTDYKPDSNDRFNRADHDNFRPKPGDRFVREKEDEVKVEDPDENK